MGCFVSQYNNKILVEWKERDFTPCSDEQRNNSFESNYTIIKHIRDGGNSSVKLAKQKKSGEHLVCKIVSEDTKQSLQEVNILRQLQHKNILEYKEHFIESGKIYIVTEYMAKGDLLDYIDTYQYMPESMCRDVIKNVLEGFNS